MSALIVRYEALTLVQMDGVAAQLAGRLEVGDVICLHGDLGAGKTTLARQMLRHLGVTEAIPSPTFTLVQTYDARLPVWHFDLYRLAQADAVPDEIIELGLEEALAQAVCLIEWPDRLGAYPLQKRLDLWLSSPQDAQLTRGQPDLWAQLPTDLIAPDTRTLEIMGDSTWHKRLKPSLT